MHDADVPAIVREPLRIGRLTIPSRFFLAPLAGYTSLAFRLAVRQCGGLGLATTDLVNARSILERRRRAFELAETCDEDRPLSIQIYGQVVSEMRDAARWVVDQGASAVSIGRGALSNPFIFRQLAHWAEHGTAGPEPTFEERVELMCRHFHGLVDRRGERLACLQFRKLVKWYSHSIRPPKPLYHRLI